MYLFRVLNDFDMLINPIKNGIASKKMIYDLTKRHLYNVERSKMILMTDKQRDEYIKSYMPEFLKKYKYNLSKNFTERHIKTRNTIHSYVEDKEKLAYFNVIKDLSTVPNHLVNGSKMYTNWISATNNFDAIWRYYDKQKVHEIAVLNVYTNGAFDENTYIVDLSNRDTINKIKFISKKIDENKFDDFIKFMDKNPELNAYFIYIFNKYVLEPTNKKFMGFNFSIASSEFCIYEYLSKESIISVLESLQIDLICADLFNEDYLLLSSGKQAQELEKLKNMMLKHILKENNPYMLYVFEELYLKKHNITEITDCIEEQEKITLMRNEIISKSQLLPTVLIKRKK